MSSTPSIRVYDSHHYPLPHHRRPSIATPAVAMAIPRVRKPVFQLPHPRNLLGALCAAHTLEIASCAGAKKCSWLPPNSHALRDHSLTVPHCFRHAKRSHHPCLLHVTLNISEAGRTRAGNGVTQTAQGTQVLAEIGSRQLDLARACTVEPQAATRGNHRSSTCSLMAVNPPSPGRSTI